MLSQRSLAAFRSVMTTGSISGAAVELAISQPAVSRHVRDLEAATGLTLFDRAGNRVIPTEAAHALVAEVDRAFVGLSEIETAAREIRRGRRDRLRIAAMPALSISLLPDVVSDLRAGGAMPDLEIVSASTPSVLRIVARGQASLGLVAPVVESPELRLLAHERVPLRCVMRADDPLAGVACVRVCDLADRDLVGFTMTTATGAMLEQVFARMENPPRVVARARLSSVVSALALRGLGVAIVDAFSAADHEARGGVSRPIAVSETFGFSVIAARGTSLPPAAEAFLERLRARVVGSFGAGGAST